MDTVYSYGGGEILLKVFNGIGMLTKSNSAYFTNVLYLSAVIGGIIAAARAIPGGRLGIFSRSWLIPTYIILSLLLVPKTRVEIIDQVDPTFVHDAVDNIPVGIAFIASASSTFARELTDIIENLFVSENGRKVVPSFAAKLMSEARYVRIQDPTIRKNIKDFARQCFRLPYVLTNLGGKRQTALHTNDIIGFVQANPHPWLGIYWENEMDGSIQFLGCRDAATRVRQAMSVEGEKSLSSLVAGVFGKPAEEVGAHSAALRTMAQDVWQTVAKSTSAASKALEQQMMVNAYREARDDKKDEFGMNRISPELLSYSTTRIMAQQNTGFLMKAAVAGSYMPMLQSVAFALLLIIGVIIVPLTLLPNGIKVLLEWVKMVISVQLWPVFSAIINGVAYMYQQKASSGVLMGTEGFSIATQTGLADAAYDVACWMGALQLSLPLIAWAFVSKSGIAVSQLMSSFSGGLEGGASKIGAETADGNITFDTQSFRNQTMGNVQYAQQQYGANENYGSSYSDGKIATTTSVYGQQTSVVQQDGLTTNMSSNDNISAQAAKNYSDAVTLAENQSRSLGQNLADRAQKTVSLIDTASKGFMVGDNISKSVSSDMQHRANEVKNQIEQYGIQENLNAQTISEMALRANSAGTPTGMIAKLITGAEISGGIVGNAISQESYNKFKNSDIGKNISEGVGVLTSYATQNQANFNNSTAKQASDGFSASNEHVKTSAEQLQKSYTRAENWSAVQTASQSKAFSSATNENPAWISYVAQKEGTDTASAVHTIEKGGANIDKYRSEFISDRTQALQSLVNNADHVLSQQEIDNHLATVNMDVGEASIHKTHNMLGDAGLQSSDALQHQYATLKTDIDDHKAAAENQYGKTQNELDSLSSTKAHDFSKEQGKLNIERMGRKSLKDMGSSARSILGTD